MIKKKRFRDRVSNFGFRFFWCNLFYSYLMKELLKLSRRFLKSIFYPSYSTSFLISSSKQLCLILLQVPKCFMLVQIFWASPRISLHLVPLQKLWNQPKMFFWSSEGQALVFSQNTVLQKVLNQFLFCRIGDLWWFWVIPNGPSDQ